MTVNTMSNRFTRISGLLCRAFITVEKLSHVPSSATVACAIDCLEERRAILSEFLSIGGNFGNDDIQATTGL